MADTEENAKKEIEIVKVDKFRAGWYAPALFQGYTVRVVLLPEPAYLKALNRLSWLKKKLKDNIGVEGEMWFARSNVGLENEDEIYLKNSSFLVVWKMTNYDEFNNMVAKLEQHREGLEDEQAE
jgi:hypothetical protein